MAQIPASILRIGVEGETLLDALPRMREAYCGTIAYQIEHLASHQQRMWLREMIETGCAPHAARGRREAQRCCARLIEVFQFERFLQKAYLGQKMFSIEGLDVIVPMIDELVTLARRERRRGGRDRHGASRPARRPRPQPRPLGRVDPGRVRGRQGARAGQGDRGDAPLAAPATSSTTTAPRACSRFDGDQMKVRLYPNPSHLEFVDPVVTGGARAAQTEHSGPKLHHNPHVAVPVLLHGDAAFPGQGVVAETLNLQSLAGYSTGGTIHLITDNQVGFTTDPDRRPLDPLRGRHGEGLQLPDHPRQRRRRGGVRRRDPPGDGLPRAWGRDVVIDLIGYRRYGHNETDEPAYTQPRMAAQIKDHPPVSELYAERLVAEGVVTLDEVVAEGKERLEQPAGHAQGAAGEDGGGRVRGPELDRRSAPASSTGPRAPRSRPPSRRSGCGRSTRSSCKVPDSFTIHRKLRKPLLSRVEKLDQGDIEFGHAEALAFASLLTEGTHIRLTGQDTERGTFSHRHLALHDENTGLRYVPIQNLSGALAPFELHNSPLSEAACLGFEYGYSAASPE